MTGRLGDDFPFHTGLRNVAIIMNCSLPQCTVETFAAIGYNLNTVIIMFEFEPFNTVIASRYFCAFFDLWSLWPKNSGRNLFVYFHATLIFGL